MVNGKRKKETKMMEKEEYIRYTAVLLLLLVCCISVQIYTLSHKSDEVAGCAFVWSLCLSVCVYVYYMANVSDVRACVPGIWVWLYVLE